MLQLVGRIICILNCGEVRHEPGQLSSKQTLPHVFL